MRLKQLFSPARIGIILGLATRSPISLSTLERHTSLVLYIPGTLQHLPSRNMRANFLPNCFVLSVDYGTKKPSKSILSFKIFPIPRAIVTIYWIQSHSRCCKAHSIMRKCKLFNTYYNYSPCRHSHPTLPWGKKGRAQCTAHLQFPRPWLRWAPRGLPSH